MEEENNKKQYKVRHIRMSEETWELLKDRRWKSKKSWNQFILSLLKKKNGRI